MGIDHELSLVRGSNGETEIGRLKVTLEMRGVPRSTLLGSLHGLPSKMLLRAGRDELQGSVLVIGSAQNDSKDSKAADGKIAKVVMGAPAHVQVDDLQHIDDSPDEYSQRV